MSHRTLVARVLQNVAIALVQLSALGSMPGFAPAADSKPQQWALLIAAEDYHKAPKLQFTTNDVRRLRETLINRGGFKQARILTLTDDGATDDEKPLKSSLETRVPEFLKQPTAEDSVVVYFSGHGFRDKDGKLYLAPLDCDPANAATTGIPADWLRGLLDACPASFKLLILDACHAGSEKQAEVNPSVSSKDISDAFKGAVGVVTLASSTGEQKSRIWEFKQQSLFSFWLNEALKGHADSNGDGAVNVDELYDYVHGHVGQTAKLRFSAPQTPVRIIGARVPGVPTVVQLVPQSLKQVMGDMAEQVSAVLEEHQYGKVGVLEFTALTAEGEALGANFGILGRYCGDELQRRLMDRSAGKFSVLDRNRLQAAMKTVGFQVRDLESDAALTRLSKNAGGLPVLAVGMLQSRSGRVVTLRCRVKETLGEKALGEVGGVAQLSESEWAMTGRSVEVRPEDRRPEIGPGNMLVRPVEDQVIERLDARSTKDHPLKRPDFAFPVSIRVKDEIRPPLFLGNDCFVMLRQGEEYEIWIENRSEQTVVMRLLVDGLNTLCEKETDTKGVETWLIGKPSSLNDARHWILDPDARDVRRNNVPTYAVRGFVSETGEQGKVKKFQVVDAEQSLAARQRFTDNIGLITAAIFTPGTGGQSRAAIGTAAGRDLGQKIEELKDVGVGNLIVPVHIRYVDEETFKKIRP